MAASSAFRGNELAEGFVRKGQRLLVQACRFAGRASTARVSVSFVHEPKRKVAGKTQIVDVSTPTRADKRRLQTLGLDLTEHGDADSIEVVLYGEQDEDKLRAAKFKWTVRIKDLDKRVEQNRRADRRYSAAQAGGSALPSGRTTYRHLADYELELKTLAAKYPKLVRPITLNHKTHEGRDVVGIEIATNPYRVNDGKPIFANMGTHHAREWPAAESTMEWAYDLLTNYGKQARTTRLVKATRNIVIPVVNPDGFNISREAPDAPPETEFDQFSYEMKRKNCWPNPAATGPCNNSTAGRLLGVDPNRNYGAFWGGSGASVDPLDDTYRGTGPFSEPETQNIRELQSTRAITNLITNHTFSNLVLRPPGVVDVGAPLEEPLLKDLGARMAGHNGYSNIPGYGLYDTTGSTEDWTFWAAGSLGYTFEIGDVDFHPPYEVGVVNEYLGLGEAAGSGKGGNREAYYEMLASTAKARDHSVISGNAPKGWNAEDPQELHDLHLAGVAERLRHGDRRSDPVPGRAVLRVRLEGRALRLEREPVDPARGGRPRRPRPGRAEAGGHPAGEPGRIPGGEHGGQLRRRRVRGDPVHRPGAARRGQRSHDRPHRVGQPGDRLGPLRGQR